MLLPNAKNGTNKEVKNLLGIGKQRTLFLEFVFLLVYYLLCLVGGTICNISRMWVSVFAKLQLEDNSISCMTAISLVECPTFVPPKEASWKDNHDNMVHHIHLSIPISIRYPFFPPSIRLTSRVKLPLAFPLFSFNNALGWAIFRGHHRNNKK